MPVSQRVLFIGGVMVVLILIGGAMYYPFSRTNTASDLTPPSQNSMEESGAKTNTTAQEPAQNAGPGAASAAPAKNAGHRIILTTSMGEIQFITYDMDAPKTVKNFIALTQKGFYHNLIFHRVIKGFMIQGGDPNGNGTGGPGYTFADELNPDTVSYQAGYQKGVIAMANSGLNTNGSQFFIMLESTPLPHNYTIFGKVVRGQDVVDAIGEVKTGPNDRPITPIAITDAKVEALSQ